eukprot:3898598-Pyramimonas_sp.AAC.1
MFSTVQKHDQTPTVAILAQAACLPSPWFELATVMAHAMEETLLGVVVRAGGSRQVVAATA